MKVRMIEKSFELCAEAGWYGYNVYFEDLLEAAFIHSLSKIGTLLFMEQLNTPFFRVQGEGFLIKGLLGADSLRIGIARNDKECFDKIILKIEEL